MINNKNILAIVPARGGSKGIPLKNLKKLGDYSLIARVGFSPIDKTSPSLLRNDLVDIA